MSEGLAPSLQRCSLRNWLLVFAKHVPMLSAESARARLTTLSRSRLGLALRRESSGCDACAYEFHYNRRYNFQLWFNCKLGRAYRRLG